MVKKTGYLLRRFVSPSHLSRTFLIRDISFISVQCYSYLTASFCSVFRPVVKGGHRGTVPPQTGFVPPATVSPNYEKMAAYIVHPDGCDALMPV